MSNLEPVKIEILLRETIAKGIEEAMAAVKGLDSGVKASTNNLKEQIAQQRQLIREITGDIKNLTQAAKEATDPGKKAEILGDLRGAKRALAEEQATMIGMQRQQMAANAGEVASQGGLIASLGKWAIGLASVAGAMEIGKKIIESTEATAHAFEQAITAVTSATHYLFQTIASGDWSNFNDGMSTAVKGAVDFVNAMEEVNNLTNQDKVLSAAFDKKIAEAREKTYDKGKDNNSERKLGYESMISLSKQKYDNLIETQTKKVKALLDKASTDTGGKTSASEIESFISNYRSVKDMIEEGERYNELKKTIKEALRNSLQAPSGKTKEIYDKAQKEIKAMGEDGRLAGEKAFNISKIIFPIRDALAESISKKIELEAQKQQGNAFTKRSLESLENKIEQDTIAAAQKAKEDAELDNRIKATQELLKGAQGEELKGLARKLVALEAEKKLRDAIIDLALLQAKYGQEYDGKLNVSMSSKTGQLVTTSKPTKRSPQDLVDTSKRSVVATNERIKKLIDEEKKKADELAEKFYRVADAAGLLSDIFKDSNKELSEILGNVSQLAGSFKGVMKGDPAAILASAISLMAIFQTIGGDFGASDRAKSIEKVNTLLEKQAKIIQDAARQGGEANTRQKEIDILQEKLAAVEKNKAEAQFDLDKIKSQWWNLAAQIFANKGKLRDEISEAEKEIEATKELIKQAKQELLDFNSQGQTQNVLADSIAQAFQDGKGSVKDFGEYTNQILRDAVLSAFKANILGDTLTNAQQQIADAFSDGNLNPKEIADIKTAMQLASDSAKSQWDALTSSFPEMFSSDNSAKGMTANIKSVTEETASALGGNISAIRINMARLIESNTTSMTMMQKSLEYQLRTADNTDAMNKTLGNIDSRLGRFENDGIKVK